MFSARWLAASGDRTAALKELDELDRLDSRGAYRSYSKALRAEILKQPPANLGALRWPEWPAQPGATPPT
jgi:hypothetical protein